jgi:hypothetical protein
MIFKSKMRALLAGALLCAAGSLTAQAQSTFVTFSVDMGTNILNGSFVPGTDVVNVRGTFNNWDNAQTPLVQVGSSTVYTNTAHDTYDAGVASLRYVFNIDGSSYESPASYNNRAVVLPTNSGAIVILPTPFYGDSGAKVTNNVTFQVDVSQAINLGEFTNATGSFVEVRGDFNGWTGGASVLTNNPNILITNQYGLVTSNVYVGTFPVVASPWSAQDFKYVIQPGTIWDSPSAINSDSGGNRFWTSNPGSDLTLPLVNFADAPYAPLSSITFSVDMSAVVLTDTNYNSASLTVDGSFNGWGTGIALTNNPAAANTNIYSSPNISAGVGSTIYYQYRYTQLSSPSTTVYDHLNGINGGSGNRVYSVANVASTNLPTVYFNDAALDDYLTQPTPVLFSVDMTNAVGTDSHVFSASADAVYVNGQFANWYAWAGGVNPAPAPAGYQMVEVGLTTVYTNTIIIPAGTPVAFAYKYGIDPNGINGGPLDDEAASGQNHYRVVRSTAFNPYVLAKDTFGNQYGEPFLSSQNTSGANLAVGAQAAGKVPVSWLGRPGAKLQVSTNLTSAWQTIPATDGTNWTLGYSSTNGFVSVTNWPANGKTFFRVIKP